MLTYLVLTKLNQKKKKDKIYLKRITIRYVKKNKKKSKGNNPHKLFLLLHIAVVKIENREEYYYRGI